MKRLVLTTVAGLAAALLVVPSGVPAAAQPPPVGRQSLVIEPSSGHDIYTHTSGSDYRIGPALINSTGSSVRYDFTCGPAPAGAGQVIRSSTSFDGGNTWGSETIKLQPTPDSPDAAGVCDPALAKVDIYYYLAYTGQAADGTRQIFVARAVNLGGPFAKWNGTGWGGGTPAPIARWVDQATGPSLVNRLGNLYLFYSDRGTTGASVGTYQIRVATASIGTNPDTWPTRLTADPGVAIDLPGKYSAFDCVADHWPADTDVKYDETTDKFLAVTSDQATYKWSALQAYESPDGHHFTRTIITRGDYQPGARDPGQLADAYGHLTPNAPKAIGYAHTSGCGAADLRFTTTIQNTVTTGAIDEPLTTSAADWHPDSGAWALHPDGYYQQTQTTAGLISETTLTTGAAGASTNISVEVRGAASSSRHLGVHFAKVHRDDALDESGYNAYLDKHPDGRVELCLNKAGFGNLGCTSVGNFVWTSWNVLHVVQSGSSLRVFLNGDTTGGLSLTDADHPFLGGYLGLSTYDGTGDFRALNTGDNMPSSGTQADWVPHGGNWEFANGTITEQNGSGQLNLRSGSRDVLLGDGTYTTNVYSGGISTHGLWGGIALTNTGATRDFASGGYLVFIRGDGNVGIYKAGVGQVVADVQGHSQPSHVPGVRLRVVKTGANFQVFVDDPFHSHPDPVINWTDTGSTWGVGGFGIADTGGYPIQFGEVSYAANDPIPDPL